MKQKAVSTMNDESSGPTLPAQILGRRVIEVCPDCEGEGRLWSVDEAASTHWAERCKFCNSIGFILDMPLDTPEMDPDDIPF